MILYHIGHYGLLSKCITHRLVYHKNEPVLFLMDEKLSSPATREYFNSLKYRFEETNIANIIVYTDDEFVSIKNSDDLEIKINIFFDSILRGYEIDKIYTGFDTFDAFGVWLNIKKIRYTLIEIASGLYELDRYMVNNNPVYDGVIRKYHTLSSDNNLVDGVVRTANHSIIERNKKDIYINYYECESAFEQDDIKKILYCFDMERFGLLNGNYRLLVCSSFWIIYHLRKSYDYYFSTYHKILDYYDKEYGRLLIKPHPNSCFDIKKWDNSDQNTVIIPAGFPSGYIHLLRNIRIEEIFGTQSSGLEDYHNIGKICNAPLIPTFLSIDSLKFVFIASEYSKICKYSEAWYFTGIDKDFLDFSLTLFFEKRVELNGFNKRKIFADTFFWVDALSELEQKEVNEEGLLTSNMLSVVYFTCGNYDVKDIISMHPELIRQIIRLDISIRSSKKEKRYYNYIFCKSEDLYDVILHKYVVKELPYTGEVLSVCPERII